MGDFYDAIDDGKVFAYKPRDEGLPICLATHSKFYEGMNGEYTVSIGMNGAAIGAKTKKLLDELVEKLIEALPKRSLE